MLKVLLVRLSVAAVMALSACQSSPGAPQSITCHVFYRADRTTGAGTEKKLQFSVPIVTDGTEGPASLPGPHNTRKATFADMECTVRFSPGSFYVDVHEKPSGKPITRLLFQPSEPLRNPFGSHGFTGLTYVYHPTSTAEMQIWLVAK